MSNRGEVAGLKAQTAILEQHIDVMRIALKRVEWVPSRGEYVRRGGNVPFEDHCPWCMGRKSKGHRPMCLRQYALSVLGGDE